MAPIEVPLQVILNASSRIQSCQSLRGTMGQSCPPIPSPYAARCGLGYITSCDSSQFQPNGQNMRIQNGPNGCHGYTDYICVTGTWAINHFEDTTCGPGEY